MNRRIWFLCAMLAGACFGKDAQQPVKKGALELGIGYGYAMIPGVYDSTGEYVSWGEAELVTADSVYRFPKGYLPGIYGVPFRIKYGLGGGVDLKAEWAAILYNEELGGLKGMGQPRLGIKYTARRAGLFSNLTLPYATGDLDDKELFTTVEVGGLLRHRVERCRFTALLSYANVLSHPDDNLRGSLQPEILWRPGLSTYLSIGGSKVLARDAYTVTLTPGLRADLTRAIWTDVSGAFSVAGKNSAAGWALVANLYWTLER